MRVSRLLCALLSLLVAAAAVASATAADQMATTQEMASKQLDWRDNYSEAYLAAQEAERNLLIFFHGEKPTKWLRFEKLSEDAEIRELLSRYTLAKIPLDAPNTVNDSSQRLIDDPAFAEMHGGEGIAIVDLSNKETKHYAHVVSVYPFKANPFATDGMISKFHLSEMLHLPAGTLTQRSMIFAVRVHPEAPVSADAEFCSVLRSEAQKHSQYQAEITDQGHHNWSSRFHSINAELPGSLTAQEVVAESWPGENLMTAAKECVYSWRRSPGHWSAVRGKCDRFGYDMKRGRDGIWYATGLFARRR